MRWECSLTLMNYSFKISYIRYNFDYSQRTSSIIFEHVIKYEVDLVTELWRWCVHKVTSSDRSCSETWHSDTCCQLRQRTHCEEGASRPGHKEEARTVSEKTQSLFVRNIETKIWEIAESERDRGNGGGVTRLTVIWGGGMQAFYYNMFVVLMSVFMCMSGVLLTALAYRPKEITEEWWEWTERFYKSGQ